MHWGGAVRHSERREGRKKGGISGQSETHSFSNPLTTKQNVHLFQCQSLRLRHKEPNERSTPKRQNSKENESPKSNLLQHNGRDLANDEIRHPVRGRTKCDTVSAIGQGPHFANDDPGARTPAVAKVDDKKPDHADRCPTGGLVSSPLVLVYAEEDGDDGVTDTHGYGSCEQDRFSP